MNTWILVLILVSNGTTYREDVVSAMLFESKGTCEIEARKYDASGELYHKAKCVPLTLN